MSVLQDLEQVGPAVATLEFYEQNLREARRQAMITTKKRKTGSSKHVAYKFTNRSRILQHKKMNAGTISKIGN